MFFNTKYFAGKFVDFGGIFIKKLMCQRAITATETVQVLTDVESPISVTLHVKVKEPTEPPGSIVTT